MESTNFIYLLECADGSFYCGWTKDLPVRLVYYETAPSKEAALRREAAIKKLTHAQKLQLIAAQPDPHAMPFGQA